jgi:glycosyltransferase involved in cell wall biosynthesis
MKVMFLIPHLSGGGGERVLSDLSRALGDETVLVVFEKKFSYPFNGRMISLELPIDRGGIVNRFTGFVRRVLRFRRLLAKERPNAVISFMGEANLINALLSQRPILTVHNHMTAFSGMRGGIESFLVRTLNKALYRRATVVAVSQSIKSDLIESYGLSAERVVVIPNSVNAGDIERMASEPAVLPSNSALPVVITAGRLSAEKGQAYLIRAFAEVLKKVPCQLVMLGAGELETQLRQLSSELGVSKEVHFLGWQPNPFKYISKATVFVSPSLTEGFGLAVLEAMACKVPVIATDCPGGQREVVGELCGILVSPGSESELATAISRLLVDSSLRSRLAAAGVERVKNFDPVVFVARYRELCTRIGSKPVVPS